MEEHSQQGAALVAQLLHARPKSMPAGMGHVVGVQPLLGRHGVKRLLYL